MKGILSILVVEDDKDLNDLMKTVLVSKGYNVLSAYNGKEALSLMDNHHIDLIITDVMMPYMDGFTLLDEIRSAKNLTPVLLVTAKGEYNDKDTGFSLGADDYMVKPIDIKEMVLRVSALLRRSQIAAERKLMIGNTELDIDKLSVSKNDTSIILPPKEFFLLYKLLSYPERVFTRYEIMDAIWGYDTESTTKTVDVHISKLRSKFDQFDDFKIVAVRGLGYKAVIK